jgi:hypothetical protein
LTASLLDRLMPEFDFRSRHTLVVAAPADAVAAAVSSYRMEEGGSPLVRALFRVRGLEPVRGTLRSALTARGFRVLAEEPGQEVVFGIAGRFWAVRELRALVVLDDAEAFAAYTEPGSAKAALSLQIQPWPGGTRLSTETRVKCVDSRGYRRFALYWALIKPFSGWIRRDVLRGIAERARA